MEAALVSVGAGVMKPLLSKLYNALKEEGSKLKGVRGKVEATGVEMRSMNDALEVLADVEHLDPVTRSWRDDVRELSYDMDDCLDDFMARADHKQDGPKSFKGFFNKLMKLKPRHEIANKIEELKARAIEASNRHKRYQFDRLSPDSTTSDIDPRLHTLYVEVDELVGIIRPKKNIIEWFEKEACSTQLPVVSIVGPGGLGKTTLANAVFETIKGGFSCAAFVSLSRKPNMKNVLRDIAQRVEIKEDISNDDDRRLIDRIRDHLQDKKYLIVIDDIWSTEAWKTIRDALLKNDRGSRIITTTRNSTVASFCSSKGDYVYRMKPLSPADSRRLFLERAFGSQDLCPPHLEAVSKRILEKCAGLPLAIITMSSFLADQTAEDKWNKALAAIGSSLAKEGGAGDMTKILSLSYFDLPHPMRTCLLYLSAFPEDHVIHKQSLIHKWIAEGFIHEGQGRSTYEVGECYFNDLINRSLIQSAKEEYGEVMACRVHDIILDFITCKAKEENFMTSFDDAVHEKKHQVRRLSIVRHDTEMATLSGDLSHIRSLAMFEDWSKNSLLDSPALSEMSFPALRVLNLECWALKDHHLNFFGNLPLLKYLRLSGTPFITALPVGIEKLKYLETLDMRGCRIKELPTTMNGLERLSRLYATLVYTCSSNEVIGQLPSLEELENFQIDTSGLDKFLQEPSQLTKLRKLSIAIFGRCDIDDDDESLVGNLKRSYTIHNLSNVQTLISSYNIQHLSITDGNGCTRTDPLPLESWSPDNPAAFRKICIKGYKIDKVPNWMDSLVNLRGLDLSMYRTEPEDVAILGRIPALVFLNLVTFFGRNGRILISGFRCLKYFKLVLQYCGTSVEFEEGSMPKLEHLELKFRAHKRACVNYASDFGIQHLSTLTKVDVCIYGGYNHHFAYKIEKLIKTAVSKLRNRPTISLNITPGKDGCKHIEQYLLSELQLEERYKEEAGIKDQQIGASYRSFMSRLYKEIKQDASPRNRMQMLEDMSEKQRGKEDVNPVVLSESDEEEDMNPDELSESDEEEDMNHGLLSESDEEEDMNPDELSDSDEEEDMNPGELSESDEEEDMNHGLLSESDEEEDMNPDELSESDEEEDMNPGELSESDEEEDMYHGLLSESDEEEDMNPDVLSESSEEVDPVTGAPTPFTLTDMSRELDHLQFSLAVTKDITKRKACNCKNHVRTKKAKNSAVEDEEEDMRSGSGKKGGNDEARTSPPFTFAAMRHELGGNVEGCDPAPDASAPFTFAAMRHELGGNVEGCDPAPDASAPFTFAAMRHELGGNVQGCDPAPDASAPFTLDAMRHELDAPQVSLHDADTTNRNCRVRKHYISAKGAMQPPTRRR